MLEMIVEAGNWLGIGAVSINNIPLRDGLRPLLLRLETPDGIIYTDYTLKGVETSHTGNVTVTLNASGYPCCRQEYLDEYDQQQYSLTEQPQRVIDEVKLKFAPVQEAIGDRLWQGFSYQVNFTSPLRSIHRITVDATWELGGSIVGKTILSQGQCNMPVYHGAKNSVFTTACLKALHLYGSPQGMSFQLAPRGGLLQSFDFQYGPEGALLNYWPKMESISSVIESCKGSSRLHVVDEYRFPLAKKAATTPQRVLFTPGPLQEHEARNLWWEAIEKIYGGLRKQYQVSEPRVLPEGIKYGYPGVQNGKVMINIMGHEVEHQDWMYALAEHYLPRLAKNGIKRIFMETMCQSDASEMGMKRKLDDGAHGDLHCGSICCTWRFFPSEYWGGIKGWKYLYDCGKKLDIQIGSWAAPHLSHNSPIFQTHPEWKTVGVNSLANGGGYGIHAINALDWNTGIFDWVLDDIRRWKSEGGLDYLWFDSWSNLGLMPLNYAHRMRPNWQALSRFCGELSKMGIALSFESLSPFGVLSCGFEDLRGYKIGQDHSIAGQNDFGWWVGEEDMMFNVSMLGINPRDRSDDEVFSIKFRAMSNRGFVMLPGLLTTGKDMPDRHIQLHHSYMQVLPHMRTRRLLPGGLGVHWLDGATEIIWAHRAGALPLSSGSTVARVLGADRETLACTEVLKLSPQQIYIIRKTS